MATSIRVKLIGKAQCARAVGAVAATIALAACGANAPDEQSEDSVGSTQELLSAPDADYVNTPVGKVHKTCVREATGDDAVDFAPCRYKNKLDFAKLRGSASNAKSVQGGQAPTVNGWVENSSRNAPAGSWFSAAYSAWYVPNNPSSQSSQLVYYFPGFQNTSGTLSIIQPVLQWGNNGWFGGNYWSIASWYVDVSGVAVYSTPKTTTSGNIIDGTMVASSCTVGGSCTWNITTAVRGTATTTTLTRTPGLVYTWAAPAALEAYNLTACNQYPNNTGVNVSTNLYHGAAYTYLSSAWSSTVNSPTPSCHYGATNSPNPGTTLLSHW